MHDGTAMARGEADGGGDTLPPSAAPAPAPAPAAPAAAPAGGVAFRASHVDHPEEPRQIIAMVCMVGVVAGVGLRRESSDPRDNARAALLGGMVIYLTHSFLQLRDSVFVRPHPGFWRVVHGAGTMYLVLLGAALFLSRDNAVNMVDILFSSEKPSLAAAPAAAAAAQVPSNHPVQMKCELTWQHLWGQLTEVWFFAHVSGWWGKMCIFRDWKICWVLSIGFEILELSMGWMVPQFKECWWDSLFVDLLGANLIGMVLGTYTLRFLENRNYDFAGHRPRNGGGTRVQRALVRFSPFSWNKWEWEVFSSPKRFMQIVMLVSVVLMTELNAFMLLNALDIPKSSIFHKARLCLLALVGSLGTAEFYEYITKPANQRIGPNMWLISALMQLEILVWVKFMPSQILSQNSPMAVKGPLLLTMSLFCMWALLFFTMNKPSTVSGGSGLCTTAGSSNSGSDGSRGREGSGCTNGCRGGTQGMENVDSAVSLQQPQQQEQEQEQAERQRKDWEGGPAASVGVVEALKHLNTVDLLKWLGLDLLFFASFLPLGWLVKQYYY